MRGSAWAWFPVVVVVVLCCATIAGLLWGGQVDRTQNKVTGNRELIKRVNAVSVRADVEIATSRVESVYQTCLQFNDVQGALSRVIRATFTPRLDPQLRAAFRRELVSLRPNDCRTQRRLLVRAIRTEGFEHAAVPYRHRYPHPGAGRTP